MLLEHCIHALLIPKEETSAPVCLQAILNVFIIGRDRLSLSLFSYPPRAGA